MDADFFIGKFFEKGNEQPGHTGKGTLSPPEACDIVYGFYTDFLRDIIGFDRIQEQVKPLQLTIGNLLFFCITVQNALYLPERGPFGHVSQVQMVPAGIQVDNRKGGKKPSRTHVGKG